jgi:general secretion pathway protein A
MYETFYGLREKPFSLFPDHRFLYLNRRYQLALSLLEFGVLNHNGMILLTGDPGTGKTTLLQKILSTIDQSVIVGMLPFTQDKGNSLLPWVLKAFDLQTSSLRPEDLFQVLTEFFKTKVQEQHGLLLVVDEAQNLDMEKLEELRLLFNLNDGQGLGLQILLAGHTQLREQLHDPQLQAFVQRIGTDFSLEPFNQEDTQAYIRHRLQAVEGALSLFSDAACDLVYRYTKGNPRLINQLCETSLLYGFSDHIGSISEYVVAEAAKDRLQSGLLPLTQIEDIASSPEPKGDLEPMRAEQELPPPNPPSPVTEVVTPMSDSPRRWEDAMKLKEQGWYLEAIRGLKTVAADSAYHRKGWFQVGQCYLALGRHSAALEAFRTALGDSPKQPPESAPIYHAIGQVLASLGRHEEANRYVDLTWLADPSFVASTNPNPHTHFDSAAFQQSTGTFPKRSKQSWWVKTFRRWWSNLQPN